jgi:hypothetical protein
MYKAPFKFIISPINNEQYVNQIGNLIVNTSIEEAEDVQRIGIVQSLPFGYSGFIKKGDAVVVQHNVFRITFDDRGIPRQSDNFIKDNLFGVTPDIIYAVIRDGKIMSSDDYIFVEPIVEEDFWLGKQTLKNQGFAKYVNPKMEAQGVTKGVRIAFGSFSEYLFEIFGEKLFLMRNKKVMAILD